MKRVIVLSTLLVFQLNCSFTLAEVFQIHRTRPQALSGWQNGIDFFRIPSSLCGSSDYECSVFNALSGAQGCNCTCPGEKSTFTLFESQWSCIENNDVRSNLQSQQYSKPGEKACAQEMETLFVNEFSNASLRTLKAGDEKAISIRNNWHSCVFDRTHSWYFGCGDSRLSSRLRLDTMMNLFTLTKGDFHLNLKVGSSVSNTHLLSGRIINLGIYCRNESTTQTRRGCLLFKLGGNITCPIENTGSPGTSTPQPDTPTSFTGHITTGTKPTHPRVSVALAPSSSFVSSPPITSVAQRNVSSHVPSFRPSSGPKPDGSGQSKDGVSSISVWLVSGLIVSSLFIVIIAGFLIVRRSHSRKKANIVTMTTSQRIQGGPVIVKNCDRGLENDAQGRIRRNPALMNQHTNSGFRTDELHGYFTLDSREPAVYASMYQVPMIDRRTSLNQISNPLEQDPNTGHIYDVLDLPQEHSIFEAQNSSELPPLPPKVPTVDNSTKFQNYGQISIEQLVYNIVEEILASGNGNERPVLNDGQKQTEPEYNVLEPDPQRDVPEESDQYEEVTVKEAWPIQDTSEKTNQHDAVIFQEPELSCETSGQPSPYNDVTVEEPKTSRETLREPNQYDDVTVDGPAHSILEELDTNSSSAID